MAYRFSLDALLRLQRSLEVQQEQRLLAISGLVAKLENQIEILESSCRAGKRAAIRALQEIGNIADLHFAINVEQLVARKRDELLDELKRAREEKKEQTERYHEIHRRTETLASLDAEQRDEYKTTLSRRDQQLSDEVFLMRKGFEPAD
jgi:DNA mismatch repair ATPase MutS